MDITKGVSLPRLSLPCLPERNGFVPASHRYEGHMPGDVVPENLVIASLGNGNRGMWPRPVRGGHHLW